MIQKNILSETSIYFGKVKMPKGFEIEEDELVKNIILSSYYENVEYPFSRTWDKLKTYVLDFLRIEHNLNLINKKTFGNFYEKNEISQPKLEIDPIDLKNSPDFVFLYGVEIDPKTCEIIIHYDNNRRKGKTWKIFLEKKIVHLKLCIAFLYIHVLKIF